MKQYIIKGLIFLIPLYLFIVIIIIIDPYEFINVIHVIGPDTKIEVLKRSDATSPRGSMLWKLIHYKRNPKKNLIIGDSQSLHIKESLVKEISGKDYFNFSIPGSSYETIFETFWHVTKFNKLESVYFQLGFMNFNANRSYNLFPLGKDYLDKPYLYFTSKEIIYDCYYNILFATTGDPTTVQRTTEYYDIERQNEISNNSLRLFFENYKYPEDFQLELKAISRYCKSNKIELNFIVFPVYKEVHEYLLKNNLEETNTKFKDLLKKLGNTYDLDTDSKLSEGRNNFSDYFHPKKYIVDELTKTIWAN